MSSETRKYQALMLATSHAMNTLASTVRLPSDVVICQPAKDAPHFCQRSGSLIVCTLPCIICRKIYRRCHDHKPDNYSEKCPRCGTCMLICADCLKSDDNMDAYVCASCCILHCKTHLRKWQCLMCNVNYIICYVCEHDLAPDRKCGPCEVACTISTTTVHEN